MSWRGRAEQLTGLCTLVCALPLALGLRANLRSETPDALLGERPLTLTVAIVLILAGPPLVLLAAVAAAERLAGRAWGRRMMVLVVGMLSSGLALSLLGDLMAPVRSWMVPVALLAGAAAAAAYALLAPFAFLLRVLGWSPLVVLAILAGTAGVRSLLLDGGFEPHRPVLRAPVVVVVFDELPAASLMTPRNALDPAFPGFRALAREATWYRNATTVHDFTNRAVPALVSGRMRPPGEPPYWQRMPPTLFSLLGGGLAGEAEEDLCPVSACRSVSAPPSGVLPFLRRLVDGRLRELSNGRFGRRAFADPVPRARGFTTALGRDGVSYLHVLLPHVPWRRLADGRVYAGPYDGEPGLAADEVWSSAEGFVELGYHRQREQLRLADRLLAGVMARLRALGRWDRSLVVVTADHGAAFRAGTARRAVGRDNAGEIAPVPLFVKLPHQDRGRVNDRPAETIDVLPTILAVERLEAPAGIQGRSLLGRLPDRPDVRVGSGAGIVTLPRAEVLRGRSVAIRRNAAWRAPDPWRRARVHGRSALAVSLRSPATLAVGDGPVPALVQGDVRGPARAGTRLAVALDGRVIGSAPVAEGQIVFLVPGALLTRGTHRVVLYEAGGTPAQPRLLTLRG